MKYTKEILEPVVKISISFREVCKRLGVLSSSSMQTYISRRVKSLEIDTSHFLGKASNRGKSPKNKRHWTEILVLSTKEGKEKTDALRRALLESGMEHKCVCCKLTDEWQNKHLQLEINHKNGNWKDNRRENLEFLCPNCHSQTFNFSRKNRYELKIDLNHGPMAELQDARRLERRPERGEGGNPSRVTYKVFTNTKRIWFCTDCKKQISARRTRCKSCAGKLQPTKIDWPTISELEKSVNETSYLAVSRQLGVSDNAIRKHIKKAKENGKEEKM